MSTEAKFKRWDGTQWVEFTFPPSAHTHSQYLTAHQDIGQATLTSNLGLGTLQGDPTWGTLTTGNGYTTRWHSAQPSGGGLVFSEKDGQTSMQVDGDIYVQEGAKKLATQEWVGNNYISSSGGNISGHIYLTGANASSSTANTSQVVFGTSSNNHVCISSNADNLIVNPSTSDTTGQIEMHVGSTPYISVSGNKVMTSANFSYSNGVLTITTP